MKAKFLNRGFLLLSSTHEAVKNLSTWPVFIIAVTLGATASFAFAPYHLTILLVPCFVGLVWMLDGVKSRSNWFRAAFLRGWAFGFGYFLVGLYWTAYPFLVDIERHLAYIWLAIAVLPMGLALITGLSTALASLFWSPSPLRIFVFSLFFTLGELVRGYLFGGLPWNLAGTTFVPGGSFSQAASLGGVYWLTLIVVFGCSSVAGVVKDQSATNLTYRLLPLATSLIMLSGLWIWGSYRITAQTATTEHGIVLLDSGVPQNMKFDVNPDDIVDQYLELLASVETVDNDLVVLPEGAIPALFSLSDSRFSRLAEHSSPRDLLIGTLRRVNDYGAVQKFYNSLVYIDTDNPRGRLVDVYDKRRLVPFGELPASKIVPFGEYISGFLPPAIQKLARSGFEPGATSTTFILDDFPSVAALICYEGIFPAFVRSSAVGSEWILIVSNDAWFGEGAGPAQNAAQNRYRAIELGLPVVRVASLGESGITDGYGRTTLEAEYADTERQNWRPTVARGNLPKPLPPTVYRQNGSRLLWITLLIWAIIPVIGFIVRR